MPRKKLAILGLDPGKKTGFALWTRTDFIALELDQGDVGPYVEGALKQHDLTNWDMFIGVQRFAILPGTHKKTRQPAASEVVGIVQALGRKYHRVVSVQSASTAAKFKDDTLRQLHLHTPTKGGHANDAARHVLVTLIEYRPHEIMRLLNHDTIEIG